MWNRVKYFITDCSTSCMSVLLSATRFGISLRLASLLWDSGALNMSLRVKIGKILLVFHIRSLSKETLANKIYLEQTTQNWPGLAAETKQICEELQIEDCNATTQEKDQYKILLIEACHRNNEISLRLLAKGKCERIEFEQYGRKEYFKMKNIHNVREHFRTRFGLQPFAGNYSHDRRFANSSWLCKCKEAKEEEAHLISYLGERNKFPPKINLC